jgi:hypothetical protein
MKQSFLLLFCFAWLSVGCSRAVTESSVDIDGSWTRSVKLIVQKMPGDPKENAYGDTFSPPTGSEWKSKVEYKNEDRLTTYTRKVATNEGVFTDIIIREKGVTTYKNFVTVRNLGGGRYEYFEKLVATQARPSDAELAVKKLATVLKSNLPANRIDDAGVQKISRQCFKSLIGSIFGPDEHLIGVMLLSGAGGEKRLKAKFYETLDRGLLQAIGEGWSAEERAQVARKVTQALDEDELLGKKKQSAKDGDQGGLVGLSSSVSFPGKLIETNGRVFPLTGEVYWDYSSVAADFEQIELRAVFQL